MLCLKIKFYLFFTFKGKYIPLAPLFPLSARRGRRKQGREVEIAKWKQNAGFDRWLLISVNDTDCQPVEEAGQGRAGDVYSQKDEAKHRCCCNAGCESLISPLFLSLCITWSPCILCKIHSTAYTLCIVIE